jgi:hypothetical protein
MSKLHGNAYPEKKRIEVATAHAMGLSSGMVAAATGVPAQTVRYWRMQDWFKDLVEEIRREDDNTVDAKLTNLVTKSLDVITDRLENGDFMYDSKLGQFVRKPISAQVVNKIADTMFDKRNLLRGKPTSISGKQEQITDRLAKLAIEFERFVNAKDITNDVKRINAETVEVLVADSEAEDRTEIQIPEIEQIATAIGVQEEKVA